MPVVPFIPLIAAGITAAVSSSNASKQRGDAQKLADDARIERNKQNAILEKQKQEYRDIKFSNPYDDMENTMEDLTVNQQQAQFQAQQGNQQRANMMQGLKGAAGSSGIAGLAQAMANQGQIQTQRISASIGAQEAQNQKLRAGEAGRIQSLERQGDIMVQQAESSRQATLLGMQQGQSAGANSAYQQQLANQNAANTTANTMDVNAITGLTQGLANQDWSSLSSSKVSGNPTAKMATVVRNGVTMQVPFDERYNY